MNKFKMIFNQTLMISAGILFFTGISQAIGHYSEGFDKIEWDWYIPLSFVLTGFLCSIPSAILFSVWDKAKKALIVTGIIIHFVAEGAIASLCGLYFGWFNSVPEYIIILVVYIFVYAFVWISMLLVYRKDDRTINKAIEEIRYEE